jgi:hypothetical protein
LPRGQHRYAAHRLLEHAIDIDYAERFRDNPRLMAARRDKTAQLQQNLNIKDRERLQIERQHCQIRSLALAYITVATAAILALSWALIE